MHATLDPDLSLIPITYASLLITKEIEGDFALVGLFHHTGAEKHAREVVNVLSATQSVRC